MSSPADKHDIVDRRKPVDKSVFISSLEILIYFGLDRKTKEDIPLKNRIVPNFEKLFPNFKRPGENVKSAADVKESHTQSDSMNVELEITNNPKKGKSEVEKKDMEDKDKHAQTDSTNVKLEITNNQKYGKSKVDVEEKEESRPT